MTRSEDGTDEADGTGGAHIEGDASTAPRELPAGKLEWEGEILSVQPRIRLTRSFDQRSHSYLGYLLRIRGSLAGMEREFLAAIGKSAHQKDQFRAGDRISGKGEKVIDTRLETAALYKTTLLKRTAKAGPPAEPPPPFLGVAPALEVYRARGHRRLAPATYAAKCTACIWGAEMPVEIVIDPWKPETRRFRRETFCYGPKSCPFYKPGSTRKVPGHDGMVWEEESSVDDEATSHRGPDD